MKAVKSSLALKLSLLTCLLATQLTTQGRLMAAGEASSEVTIIEPNNRIKLATAAAIDSEKFELGSFVGMLAVEDFDTNPLIGFSFSYHITPDFVATAQLAQSDVGRATFEDVVGGDFLSSSDETFEYTSLALAYRLFSGRSFSGAKNKYNSNIYLLGGVSNVDFAGGSESGFLLGATYKTVLTDWLTWDLSLKDHVVDRDFLDHNKTTHNIEWSVGLNFLF